MTKYCKISQNKLHRNVRYRNSVDRILEEVLECSRINYIEIFLEYSKTTVECSRIRKMNYTEIEIILKRSTGVLECQCIGDLRDRKPLSNVLKSTKIKYTKMMTIF